MLGYILGLDRCVVRQEYGVHRGLGLRVWGSIKDMGQVPYIWRRWAA